MEKVSFPTKFIAKIVLNAAALFVAQKYLSGFTIGDGLAALAIGGLVLAILNAFIRPILRIISFPLIFITFGLFNLAINLAILWLADQFLLQLSITNLSSLFWASIIIALANALF